MDELSDWNMAMAITYMQMSDKELDFLSNAWSGEKND